MTKSATGLVRAATLFAMLCALGACGGRTEERPQATDGGSGGNDAAADVAAAPLDASDASNADAPDGAALQACAHQCVVDSGGGGGGCPVLLTYDCLRGPCGDSASTLICEAGNGMPAPLATIQCVQAAFPSCPANTCQGSTACKAFMACIEGCH